jgi:hypothetical protein
VSTRLKAQIPWDIDNATSCGTSVGDLGPRLRGSAACWSRLRVDHVRFPPARHCATGTGQPEAEGAGAQLGPDRDIIAFATLDAGAPNSRAARRC